VVRVEVIRKRLNKLDEYLGILRGLQRYNFGRYSNAAWRIWRRWSGFLPGFFSGINVQQHVWRE
jgi:hypothetical protein